MQVPVVKAVKYHMVSGKIYDSHVDSVFCNLTFKEAAIKLADKFAKGDCVMLGDNSALIIQNIEKVEFILDDTFTVEQKI